MGFFLKRRSKQKRKDEEEEVPRVPSVVWLTEPQSFDEEESCRIEVHAEECHTPARPVSSDQEVTPSPCGTEPSSSSSSSSEAMDWSQVSPYVALSVLDPCAVATLDRASSWGKFLVAAPVRILKDSLHQHFAVSGADLEEYVKDRDLSSIPREHRLLIQLWKGDARQAADTCDEGQKSGRTAVHDLERGLVAWNSNKLGRALQSWRLATHEVLSATPDTLTAVLLNNLGVLHAEAGDVASSLLSLEESLATQRALMRRAVVTRHLDLALFQCAVTMGNLAMACELSGQVDRAIQLLDEALALAESCLADTSTMQDRIRRNTDRIATSPRSPAVAAALAKNSSRLSAVEEEEEEEEEDDALSVDSARSIHLFGNGDGIPSRLLAAKLSAESWSDQDVVLLGPLERELSSEQRVRESVMQWFGKRVDEDPSASFSVPGDEHHIVRVLSAGKESREDSLSLDDQKVRHAELHLSEIYKQAMIHLDHHEIEDALHLFHSALQSHRAKYGNHHHLAGTALHNLGMIYLFDKRYTEALCVFSEAVEVRTAALGPDHPDVQTSQLKIALIHMAVENWEKAYAVLWAIRDQFLQVLGYGHPELAKIYNNLGVVSYQTGDLQVQTPRYFELAYEFLRRKLEECKDDKARSKQLALAVTHSLCNLGFFYFKTGKAVKALEMYDQALQILRQHLEEDDRRVMEARHNIKHILQHSGRGRNGISAIEGKLVTENRSVSQSPAVCMLDIFGD
jgi:tetratricopeptide (TPR) repeat protein